MRSKRSGTFAVTVLALFAVATAGCSVRTDAAGPAVGERRTDTAGQVLVASADPGDSDLVGFEVSLPADAALAAGQDSLGNGSTGLTASQPTVVFAEPADASVAPDAAPDAPQQSEALQDPATQDQTAQAQAAQDQTAQDHAGQSEAAPDSAGAGQAASSAAAPAAADTSAAAVPVPTTTAVTQQATDREPATVIEQPAVPTPTPVSDSLVVSGDGRTEGPGDRAGADDLPMSEPASLACSTVELALGDLDRGDLGQFGAEMTVAAGFATSAPELAIASEGPNLLAAAGADDPIGSITTFLSACVALGYQL